MEDMYSFWQLDRDVPEPDLLDDDEEWWENAESEIAAAENLEEKE